MSQNKICEGMKEDKTSYIIVSPYDSKAQLYIGFKGKINISVQNSQAISECEVIHSHHIFFLIIVHHAE